MDINQWREEQDDKVLFFIDKINQIKGLKAISIEDYTGLPFSRVCISVDKFISKISTDDLAHNLKSGLPQIWTIEDESKNNKLIFELLPLDLCELNIIIERLIFLMNS